MRTSRWVVGGGAAIAGLMIAAGPIRGQEPWAFEVRASGAFPTADVGDDSFDPGIGLEGTFRYRFLPHLAAYAGWDWVHFGPEQTFAGPDMDLEETGYVFGLRFEHPISDETGSGPAVWLRSGGTVDHLEIENDEGDVVADSGHGLGWEAAAGVALQVGQRWSLTPGIRYRSLSRDVDVGDVTTAVDLRYFSAEMGLAIRF